MKTNDSCDTPDWEAGYQASQETAALFDLSYRDELRLSGEDRLVFLHGFCTNDINKLQPGQGCEAFVSSIQGKTLGHIFVFAKQDHLVIDTTPNASEILHPHLDRYVITEDVTIEITPSQRQLFYLTGPDAVSILTKMDPRVADLGLNEHLQIEQSGNSLDCRKVDWFDQPGFQISVSCDAAEDICKLLITQGATSAGRQAWEALRVQSGFPEFGIDFNSENLAQEVDRDSTAISFTKGCYLGQEPIARIDAIGHVNRLLRQVTILSAAISPESLTRENSISDGESIKSLGQITSAAILPPTMGQESKTVAIATIHRKIAEPKTTLVVKTESAEYSAIVE
ncbi:MAG: hypothetical protein JKY95_02665 [Planctomycetaceae bacterium]|nr:hypothetical protein [Planctomycetaceae bacterium]